MAGALSVRPVSLITFSCAEDGDVKNRFSLWCLKDLDCCWQWLRAMSPLVVVGASVKGFGIVGCADIPSVFVITIQCLPSQEEQ